MTTYLTPQLRRLRERRLLSQDELGRLAGVSPTTVGRIERGDHIASGATVRKLARALGVEADELMVADRESEPIAG